MRLLLGRAPTFSEELRVGMFVALTAAVAECLRNPDPPATSGRRPHACSRCFSRVFSLSSLSPLPFRFSPRERLLDLNFSLVNSTFGSSNTNPSSNDSSPSPTGPNGDRLFASRIELSFRSLPAEKNAGEGKTSPNSISSSSSAFPSFAPLCSSLSEVALVSECRFGLSSAPRPAESHESVAVDEVDARGPG